MDLDSASSGSDNLFGASPAVTNEPQAEANPESHETDPSQQQARESATYAQMEQLHLTDAKLAQLVHLAAEALAALHPTSDLELDPSSTWHASDSKGQLAKDKTERYYALLNVCFVPISFISTLERHSSRSYVRDRTSKSNCGPPSEPSAAPKRARSQLQTPLMHLHRRPLGHLLRVSPLVQSSLLENPTLG